MVETWREKLLGYGSGKIAFGSSCQATETTGQPCGTPAFAIVQVDGIGERAVCERHGKQLVEWVERLEELAKQKES